MWREIFQLIFIVALMSLSEFNQESYPHSYNCVAILFHSFVPFYHDKTLKDSALFISRSFVFAIQGAFSLIQATRFPPAVCKLYVSLPFDEKPKCWHYFCNF